MDVREKLIEILRKPIFPHELVDPIEAVADYLLDSGVTVQEWISVKERLPQENEPVDTLCENVQVLLNNGKVSVGWCNRRTKLWYHMPYDEDYVISNGYDNTPVIAWMPLAQPPKGE